MSEKFKDKQSKTELPRGIVLSAKTCQEKKAEDMVILDLSGISSFTDFFIILHGNSARQNVAICNAIGEELKKEKIKPLSIEGKENAEWILMDYGNFIVHIFSQVGREYYALEKLWGDGVKLSL